MCLIPPSFCNDFLSTSLEHPFGAFNLFLPRRVSIWINLAGLGDQVGIGDWDFQLALFWVRCSKSAAADEQVPYYSTPLRGTTWTRWDAH